VHNDHYYVKVSDDEGFTWDILLDLSSLPPYPGPGGYNQWNEPYVIDMTAYLGEVVHIAWHAVDGDGQGLWYSWAIDDCYVGSKKLDLQRHSGNGNADGLLGYDVFRSGAGSNEFVKININIVSDTFYTDGGLPAGQYDYFIAPVFTECNRAETSDTVTIDVITSISEMSGRILKIYPVPASGRLTVETAEVPVSIEILSLQGGSVRSVIPSSAVNRISVGGIPPGLYIVRVLLGETVINRKIVIN
jgi:hypothetical protein